MIWRYMAFVFWGKKGAFDFMKAVGSEEEVVRGWKMLIRLRHDPVKSN